MHIVIIGNGITGITAARFVRKRSDYRITIVSSESDHFFARTALMYVYMGDMRFEDTKPYSDAFWAQNRIELVNGHATRIDENRVRLASGESVPFDRLLIATGSQPNRFGWPGENARGVQGLYSLQDLRTMENRTAGISQAVVVGGGLIGVEMAEMLRSRGIDVTFLVREQHYMDYLLSQHESTLVQEAVTDHGVHLEMGTELSAILTSPDGEATGVQLSDGREVPAEWVGLAVGVHPNVGFAQESGVETRRGILIERDFSTSIPDVYAAGDCAEFRDPFPDRKAVEQLWYTGRSQGRQVASALLGETEAYRPPLFFNSAKFFDLEYHTYGTIGPTPAPTEKGFELRGDGRALRLVHDKDDGALKGVNGLGVRLRQNVWSDWIRSGASIDTVQASLERGLFDPEFTKTLDRMEVTA